MLHPSIGTKTTSKKDGRARLETFQKRRKASHKSKLSSIKTAISAGNLALQSNSTKALAAEHVHLHLAELYLQRSRWQKVLEDRLGDLVRARSLANQAVEYAQKGRWRVTALRNLAAVLEERYDQTTDEEAAREAHQTLLQAAKMAKGDVHDELMRSIEHIKFKMGQSRWKYVLDIRMEELSSIPVAWGQQERKRFRFINAREFAAGNGLKVVEFDTIPRREYVPLSYVWRGIKPSGTQMPQETMEVKGAVGADPVSIDVLRTACRCVLTLECELLWIDGVCIMQEDEEDKAWQIQNMYSIYKNCKACLILPGGLSRLAHLEETTSWIHRAWTLQEAVAPPDSEVLFAWDKGDCVLQTNVPTPITQIEPGAAKASLESLLQNTGRTPSVLFPSDYQTKGAKTVEVKILSGDRLGETYLLGALDHRKQPGFGHTIWRAAMTRVASRPADMVFSIMGLLEVTLDPLDFNPWDRRSSTIALMQALLHRGESAAWLGVIPNLLVNPDIPSLPLFPTFNSEGKAVFETDGYVKASSDVIHGTPWRLVGLPSGKMHDDGSLEIHAQILPIRANLGIAVEEGGEVGDPLGIAPPRYEFWEKMPMGTNAYQAALKQCTPPYAVKLGEKAHFLNGALPCWVDNRPWLVMLVAPDKDGKVKNRGYTSVSEELIGSPGWREQTITLSATIKE